MTLYDFMGLNEDEQANAVWEGEFIDNRNEGEFTLLLYCLGDFFVEVTYRSDLNRIVSMKPFKSMRLLEPYWQNVSLSDIRGLL